MSNSKTCINTFKGGKRPLLCLKSFFAHYAYDYFLFADCFFRKRRRDERTSEDGWVVSEANRPNFGGCALLPAPVVCSLRCATSYNFLLLHVSEHHPQGQCRNRECARLRICYANTCHISKFLCSDILVCYLQLSCLCFHSNSICQDIQDVLGKQTYPSVLLIYMACSKSAGMAIAPEQTFMYAHHYISVRCKTTTFGPQCLKPANYLVGIFTASQLLINWMNVCPSGMHVLPCVRCPWISMLFFLHMHES